MKPLITSPRALRMVSAGIDEDILGDTPRLFIAEYEDSEVLLTTADDLSTALVLLWRESYTLDTLVPDELHKNRREVISRMASFAERTESAQVSLPRQWHQYKFDNLMSFFAVPGHDARGIRWVTERINRGPGLTVFWQVDTSKQPTRLEDLRPSIPRFPPHVFTDWDRAIADLKAHLAKKREPADAEVYLPHIQTGTQKDQSLAGWLSVASPDQRSFIEASVEKSIRLRGPAGSGKTLALSLKAVLEVMKARAASEEIRVLFATHSWALANQITQNIEMLGLGPVKELDVFPLLAIAEDLSPAAQQGALPYAVVGDDSESGKRAQLDEVLEVIDHFTSEDWVSYRSMASAQLRERLDSSDEDERFALAWDLLTEFGSVIGAAGIFPGHGAEAQYAQLQRSGWMLPLHGPNDYRVVFRIYSDYMDSLDARGLVTTDQVMADFLGHLSSHAWNRNRRSLGYDLVFVDEFHLFSPLERQAIHYLTRDPQRYPRIFMALDPRQSPSAKYIGTASDSTRSGPDIRMSEGDDEVENVDLTTVHRFTPQILALVKHLHHEFPTFTLGEDWMIDFAKIVSSQDDGPMPTASNAGTEEAEENDVVRAVHDLYQKGRVAIAVVDNRLWPRYSSLGSLLAQSGKFHVTPVTARDDIDDVSYRSRGVVLGAAEHLAGLQFDSVLVVGLPSMHDGLGAPERRRLLSLLYLAVSRAEREVRIFTNDARGGTPAVIQRAIDEGSVVAVAGAKV